MVLAEHELAVEPPDMLLSCRCSRLTMQLQHRKQVLT